MVSQYCPCEFPEIILEDGVRACKICGNRLDPEKQIVYVDNDGRAIPVDEVPRSQIVDTLDARATMEKPLAVRMRNAAVFQAINGPKRELPGRNDPCLCGSGRKFKKCCMPS